MRLDWMILLLLVPGIAFCLPYWPEQPDGVVYHYAHPDGETLSIRYSQSGSIQDREYLYSDPDCTGGESYQISDDQVGLGEHGYYCQGGIDPVMEFFDPPLPIARSEMQPGDTWTWEGESLAGPGLVIVS